MKNIAIIGASGVAGGAVACATQAFFEKQGERCFILGTYNRKCVDVPGANAVAKADVADPNWISQIELLNPNCLSSSEMYDYGFLCFSRGDVGFPAVEATQEQKEKAFAASVQPLLDMEASGMFRTLFAFGSFHELPISQLVYGAMVYAKEQLDVWAQSSTSTVSRYQIKSAGFVSNSLRGVKLATLRQLGRRQGNPQDPLVQAFGNPDSDTLERMLLGRMCAEEHKYLGAPRLTTGDDIARAVEIVLENHARGELEPITCLAADTVLDRVLFNYV